MTFRKMFFPFFLILVMLCGCTSDARTETTLEEIPYFRQENGTNLTLPLTKVGTLALDQTHYACDLGIFSYDPQRGLLLFEDFSTGEVAPMCVKPNCSHDNSDCGAWFEDGVLRILYPYFDGQYVYFYDSSDGKYYRQSPDGSGRTAVYQPQDDSSRISGDVVIENGKMYFSSRTLSSGTDEDKIPSLGVVCVELATGKSKTLPLALSPKSAELSIQAKIGDWLDCIYKYAPSLIGTDSGDWKQTRFLYNLVTGEMVGYYPDNQVTDRANFAAASGTKSYGFAAQTELDLRHETSALWNGQEESFFPGKVVVADFERQIEYTLPVTGLVNWRIRFTGQGVCYLTLHEGTEAPEFEYYDLETGMCTPIPQQYLDYRFVAETEQFYICYRPSDGTHWRVEREAFHSGTFEASPVCSYDW